MAASDILLITGGAGYIGSHLARLAHDRGSRVILLDNLSHGAGWPRLPSEVVTIHGDVGRTDQVRDAIATYKPTAVVHLAGKISVTESVKHPASYWRENFVKTIGLLDVVSTVAPSVKAFVLASSAAVYGNVRAAACEEEMITAPITPYGASKLACEQALASYAAAYDLRWAALRFFNVAGAHPDGSLAERHDPETHLVPLAVDAARGVGPPVTIYGDGSATRDYIHVMDVAKGCLDAISATSDDRVNLDGHSLGVVNIGSGYACTANAVLATVERVLGRPVPHVHADSRNGEPRHLVAAIHRAWSRMNWSSTHDLERIVVDTATSRLHLASR